MKLKKTSILLVALLSIIACSATIADTNDIEKGYISVNESTSKDVEPNLAEISISVETSNTSLKKASEDNKIAANKVYSSLKSILGLGDFIKTSNYLVSPHYIYTKDNKKVLDKYLVSNTVVVKTKNLKSVSILIDEAIKNGATKIDNLQFSAVDYDSSCNDMLTELSKKAYGKASSIANAVNSQVAGIKSINASCSQENASRSYERVFMMKNAVGASDSTPIESGKIKLFANIDASFFVK